MSRPVRLCFEESDIESVLLCLILAVTWRIVEGVMIANPDVIETLVLSWQYSFVRHVVVNPSPLRQLSLTICTSISGRNVAETGFSMRPNGVVARRESEPKS